MVTFYSYVKLPEGKNGEYDDCLVVDMLRNG